MKTRMILTAGAAALLACVAMSPAWAVFVIDGSADVDYGTAIKVQDTRTHFGNTTLGDLIVTNNGGSEIDQLFAKVQGDRLHVLVAGNLKIGFEKLEIYIDSTGGGMNTIDGLVAPDRVDGYCCGNTPGTGALQRQNGLTFDTGFDADYYLTFSHGTEGTGPEVPSEDPNNHDRETRFWALTAHYAELTAGGARVAAGMQLGPQGRPVTLRFAYNADFNSDARVDGDDFLAWQRGAGTLSGATRAQGDANGDGAVNNLDLDAFRAEFGGVRTLADLPFGPFDGGRAATALIGPTLPNLGQGELIDKNYALNPTKGQGTGTLNDGLIAKELEFTLADDGNDRNRRDMDNTIGLMMALDNSNVAGVEGAGGAPWLTAANPEAVTTGLEFSIPLSALGNPEGDFKLVAFINNSDHDYASNQFAGDGILDANLGEDGFGGFGVLPDLSGVDLNDFAGDQFVTIPNPPPIATGVPEPGTALLAAMGLLCLRIRGRRKGADCGSIG